MPPRPSLAQRLGEPFVTGFALACIQVTLGFVAMRGLSASTTAWFVVVLCWLLGGLFGAKWTQHAQGSHPTTDHDRPERTLAVLAPNLLGVSALATEHAAFSHRTHLLVMATALAAGGYGGLFLVRRG